MRLFTAVLAATLACAPTVSARAPEDRQGWWFEGLGYAWIPGVFGDATVDDRTTRVDESVGDVLDAVFDGDALAGAGMLELGYRRWSVLVDAFGGYTDDGVRTSLPTQVPGVGVDIVAKLRLKQVFVDFDVAYRLAEWSLPNRSRPLALGIFAGARSYWLYGRLRASAATTGLSPRQERRLAASEETSWADPVIGLRWEVPLLDALVADFRGDVGGFGAGSNFSWGLTSGLRHWMPWQLGGVRSWLAGGYKMLAFDYDFSSRAGTDLTFRGPYLGVGVAF